MKYLNVFMDFGLMIYFAFWFAVGVIELRNS
jgi:hypothetical protein